MTQDAASRAAEIAALTLDDAQMEKLVASIRAEYAELLKMAHRAVGCLEYLGDHEESEELLKALKAVEGV